MRNLILVVLTMLALSAGPALGVQETSPKGDFPPGMYVRIPTLNLPGQDAATVLAMLADQAKINIVISKSVSGRCSLHLKDVTIKDAFDIILLSNNLAYDKRGDIYYIMTAKEYRQLHGTRYGDTRQVKIIRLKHAVPATAFELISGMISNVLIDGDEVFGKVIVDTESGTVLIVDAPETIKKIEEALAVLEIRNEILVFDINYATAAEVEERVKDYLEPSADKRVGSVKATATGNRLVVQTLSGRMEGVRDLIAALDQKTRQVLIDTKIIKIELKDDFAAELKWEGIFTGLAGVDFLSSHALDPIWRTGESFIGQYQDTVPDTVTAGSKSILGERIFFGSVDSNQAFEGLLTFLRTLGDVKILSNPKITAIDGQEARIHVGRREPLLTSTISTTGTAGGQTTSESVEFIDVGILLAVTPTINAEGFIRLDIKPEVIDLITVLETKGGSILPIVDTSSAETTVIVKDGSTIMIGGLRKDRESTTIKKVPLLGSIPILGYLFRSHESVSLRSELLIMLTPYIISGESLETGDPDVPPEGFKPYLDYNVDEVDLGRPAPGIEGQLSFKGEVGSVEIGDSKLR